MRNKIAFKLFCASLGCMMQLAGGENTVIFEDNASMKRAAAIKGLALVDQYSDQPRLKGRLLAKRFPPVPCPEQRFLDRVLAVALLGEHRAGDSVEPALTGSHALNKVSLQHW